MYFYVKLKPLVIKPLISVTLVCLKQTSGVESIIVTSVIDIMADLAKQVSIYSWKLKPLILSCSEPEPFLRAALTNFQAELILCSTGHGHDDRSSQAGEYISMLN